MSLFLTDVIYLGLKTCYYTTKFIGIAGYNTLAYLKGYEMIEFFPKSSEQLLLEEVRDLKEEIQKIRMKIHSNSYGYEEIIIEEIEDNPALLLTN